MKAEELTGAALDYWVAKANGDLRGAFVPTRDVEISVELFARVRGEKFHYSTNWEQGGPIIERERIAVDPLDDGTGYWMAGVPPCYGPTPLIAAMHAYVVSKFGVEFVEKS